LWFFTGYLRIMWKQNLGPIYPYFYIGSLLLAILSFARLVHTYIFFEHLDSYYQILPILINGVRIDLVVLACAFGIPILVFSTLHTFFKSGALSIKTILIYWSIAIAMLLVFFEIVTPFYMNEYGVRPERKFFEYLTDPKEVLLMLWGMYGFALFIIFGVLAGLAPLMFRIIKTSYTNLGDWTFRKYLWLFPILIIAIFMSIRSSFDHRPINPSMVAFTDDALVNSLPLNSLYSVLYAAYRLKDEENASDVYGKMSRDEIFTAVHNEYEKHNFYHAKDKFDIAYKHKNLVLILEESLGARYVKRLGGKALTPNLNKLAEQGWWFNHLYATGTRSVRGIEAIVSGFLPTPGRSVVKLSNSQSNFFTIASLLRKHEYLNRFYYGGNAHFDNMKGFFLGNGFHEVVEQKDFIKPHYVGSWGASDEDVFERMHQDLMANTQQPNLMMVLTTSNHTPFDFPVYTNDLYSDPIKSRVNAIHYADKALGEFIDKAKHSSYWDNTVFLIVADHDQRVSDFIVKPDPNNPDKSVKYFPVEGFHIPGLILGGGIQPKQLNNVVSQIDIPPTLLSMIGVSTDTPMLGTDLTMVDDSYVGRAIMQFNDHQAYLEGDSLVVLRPGKLPLKGVYKNKTFIPKNQENLNELAHMALAHALWASIQYKDKSYN